MDSKSVRQQFISFFKNKDHSLVSSSSLLPQNDQTLLFVNAGMNQFKNIFLGLESKPFSKAISIQKCLRAGGKHNDLENVGFTSRHHTFFEMLGNFSFGDYFKQEAIHWAWEFLTQNIGLSKKNLYITVFDTDDETEKIWREQEGVPASRIFKFGEKDNFWRMGDTGPCGPCTEIHYNFGPSELKTKKDFERSSNNIMEVWNLVFMQFYEDGTTQTSLKKCSVDTGMGLERLSTLVQGEKDNFHTDLFMPLIEAIELQSKYNYCKDFSKLNTQKEKQRNIAFRVLADHIRAAVFLIHDGVSPTGEGRGYVLRRIIRRALRYGHILSKENNIFSSLAQKVITTMKEFYPLLEKNSSTIYQLINEEETRFLKTLGKGSFLLDKEIKKIGSNKTLNGQIAFQLYDTYGFPLDLTEIILKEHSMKVDKTGFEKEMQKAKNIAKKTWTGQGLNTDQKYQAQIAQQIQNQFGATEFIGYEKLTNKSPALFLSHLENKNVSSELNKKSAATLKNYLKKGDKGLLITKTTAFYPEGGGQVGDRGTIETEHGGKAHVFDCQKHNDILIHFIEVTEGQFPTIDKSHSQTEFIIILNVNKNLRAQTAKNHSATHLLHSALKRVLGDTVSQSGSLVNESKLRFDFSYSKKLTPNQIEDIESLVNCEISKMHPVATRNMPYQKALKEGALSCFGEKYSEIVRVLTMENFSKELCGGTHVKNTGEIQMFKIVAESSVSAGVRRIEALTGTTALEFLNKIYDQNKKIRQELNLSTRWTEMAQPEILKEINNIKQDKKNLIKQLKDDTQGQFSIDTIISEAKSLHLKSKNIKESNSSQKLEEQEFKYIFTQVKTANNEVLKKLNDRIRDKMQTAVVILLGDNDKTTKNAPLVIGVAGEAKKFIHAGQLLKKLAEKMDGRGGGRADFAQGVVKDTSKRHELAQKLSEFL